jgi:hypothetical protein
MPNSLRTKLSKLRYKRQISDEEYRELTAKLDGHDKELLDKIRAKIKELSNANSSYWHSGDMVDRDDVFQIIDNYKAERSGEDADSD